jgi:hypothetical protein
MARDIVPAKERLPYIVALYEGRGMFCKSRFVRFKRS